MLRINLLRIEGQPLAYLGKPIPSIKLAWAAWIRQNV